MNSYTLSNVNGISGAYSGANSAIIISGQNTRGGSGYFDFLLTSNTSSGATNQNKSFRLNSTGAIQIVNSAYNASIFTLDDTGNIIIPKNLTLNNGISYQSYSGFIFTGTTSTVALLSSQNGYLIQIACNVTLPSGSSVAIGGKFSFANHTSSNYTITVNDQVNEFIYNGGTILSSTNRSITIQAGETLELMSRGATEWDVTGGSCAMRYQSTPPVLKSYAVNQAAGTTVALNVLKAYMSSGGALFLGSNTGSNINIVGQAYWSYYGGFAGATISLSSLNSMTSASASPSASGYAGDSIMAIVTDQTSGTMYRVTGQQITGTRSSSNFNICIEQLC